MYAILLRKEMELVKYGNRLDVVIRNLVGSVIIRRAYFIQRGAL